MEHSLVYNIEPASPSMIRSLDRHCRDRIPDGASAIDPARSNQNAVLVGNAAGVLASLDALYASGVQPPASQSEAPYLRIVVSASPGYFRPRDPDAAGTWDQGAMEAWRDAVMGQLQTEHGPDLVYAELHLDEDTPHIHAVIAPTYGKKPRKPGRQKRNETPEQFEARKAEALAADGVRTVGRASHPTLSQKGSFQRLRERMAVAVDHLGIGYGEDRSIDAPPGIPTREWVKQQAAEIRVQRQKLDQDKAEARAMVERAQIVADRIKSSAERRATEILDAGRLALAQETMEIGIALDRQQQDLDRREDLLREKAGLLRRSVDVLARAVDVIGKKLGLRLPEGLVDALDQIDGEARRLSAPKEPAPETGHGPGF